MPNANTLPSDTRTEHGPVTDPAAVLCGPWHHEYTAKWEALRNAGTRYLPARDLYAIDHTQREAATALAAFSFSA